MAFIRAGMVLQDFPTQYRKGADFLGGVRPEGQRNSTPQPEN